MSAGAWTDEGHGDVFLPWPGYVTGERLEALFRRKVLAMLVRQRWLAPDSAKRLAGWTHSGFSVGIGEPIEPREITYPPQTDTAARVRRLERGR